MNYDGFIFFITKYLEYYPFLIPLGFIGIWRWSVWGIKKYIGLSYKPQKTGFKSSVSIVTPVYNENPQIFYNALHSWAKNKPNEIIAVIDYTDKNCIKIFEKFAKGKKSLAKLIITKTPGKREALAAGIKVAKSKLIALIDSDTMWDKHTLVNAIAPFKDKKIGGVATKQSTLRPETLAQKLFSIRLEQRYWDDIPFLSRSGDILVCLSGRTAFYRKTAIVPFLKDLTNEFFMKEKVISGEDKRLTYLIEAAGWKATYQSSAQVYTVGEKSITSYLNQQIRWTRNSWRADLKAIFQGWVFRSPTFSAYLIDRIIQPFTLLISPIYFVISIYFGLWIPVLTIVVWWLVSRTIKMYPHLKKYPLDIVILPIFILFNFITAYIKIYSLLSINTQGWITRWDKARLQRSTFFQIAVSHSLTLFIFGLVATIVYFNKYQTFLIPAERQKQLVARALPLVNKLIVSAAEPSVLGAFDGKEQLLLTKRYKYQTTDTLSGVAEKHGVTLENLLQTNLSKITNWNNINPGIYLTIPPTSLNLVPQQKFNYQRIYDDVLSIYYDQPSDHIIISGRGKTISFLDIARSVGDLHLKEVSPGVWDVKTSLYLRSGITLKIDKKEVKWLRFLSSDKKFTRLFAYNSDILINGVKITSWDEAKKDFDKNLKNGRSYILVKDGSRMDLTDSEVAYLGYSRPADSPYSTYGISWRMSTGSLGKTILTGEIRNSKFHHNYFGAYTFGATGMTWRGNEFYSNVRYGLDPHDDSNYFLIENNVFRDNGTHGLILSKRCIGNVIRNNVSYRNKQHGIMLHVLSNENIIENNKLFENIDGIAIDQSSNNIIRNNSIYNNKNAIRANKTSVSNLIEGNTIRQNSMYGIYLYGKSGNNIIRNNVLTDNLVAVYLKSNKNNVLNNSLNKNKIGIYFFEGATQNGLAGNTITYSKSYGVYAKVPEKLTNYVEKNNLIWRNRKDVIAAENLQKN